MIDDEFPVSPIGSLQEKPGYGDTLKAAVTKPFYEVGGAAQDLFPQLSSEESRKSIADTLDVVNEKLSDPRLSGTQSAFDWVASMGASLVATAPLAVPAASLAGYIAGDTFGLADGLLSTAASKFLRTPINKLVQGSASDYLPGANIAEISKRIAQDYGAYKGMTIPEHVVENYQKEHDVLNSDQALEDWSKDNYGFAVPLGIGATGYLVYKALGVRAGEKAAKDLASTMVAQHEQVRSERQNLLAQAFERAKGAVERDKLEQQIMGRKSDLENAVNTALDEKRLSPLEHKALKYFLDNPHDTQGINKLALAAIQDKQLPIDRVTGRYWFEVMDNKSIRNLKQALADRVATDLPKDQQADVMDYISNNRYDTVISMLNTNPELKSMMRGFLLLADKKLGNRDKTLKSAKALLDEHVFKENRDIFNRKQFPYLRLQEVNRNKLELMKQLHDIKEFPEKYKDTVLRYGQLLNEAKEKFPNIEKELEHLKGNMLSQENIYKHLKETGLPKKGAPYIIPDIVNEKLSVENRLANAKDMQESTRLGLYNKGLKFETIPQEIKRLTESLQEKVKPNYRQSKEYNRLRDLASTRDDAKQAMGYIDMIHEYNRQKALNTALNAFLDMADSTVARFADPNKVIQYLHKRLEQEAPIESRGLKEINDALAKRNEVPAPKAEEGKKTVKEPKINENINAKSLAGEYESEKALYHQVANNLNVLKEAVNCVWGVLNG